MPLKIRILPLTEDLAVDQEDAKLLLECLDTVDPAERTSAWDSLDLRLNTILANLARAEWEE